jgi:hypothetical protein
MVDGGVVPKDNLKIVEGPDGTTVIVKSPTKEVPEWEKITLETPKAVGVQYTPVDESGKKTGVTKFLPVTDDTKTVTIVFTETVKTAGFYVVPVSNTPNSATVKIVSVVACIASDGKSTV